MAVKAAPAEVSSDHVERLLLEILDGVGREARVLSLDLLRGKIAASISCHAAIKVNMSLDRDKMKWLIRELGRTECPMTCPHGRPIMLRYGMREIQKAFKRIGLDRRTWHNRHEYAQHGFRTLNLSIAKTNGVTDNMPMVAMAVAKIPSPTLALTRLAVARRAV